MKNAKSEAIRKKTDIDKESNRLIEKALDDEYEAIDTYEKILSMTDDEEERKVFEEILKDEEDHSRLLIRILQGESTEDIN